MKDLDNILSTYSQRVEEFLNQHLYPNTNQPNKLHDAIRYSTLNGGKRIRPALVYATASAIDLEIAQVDPIAASIELMHSYSLIHDDLPAMDDDDLRRGKPTCHRAFDEATAILAGDAMQALAFSVLTDQSITGPNAATRAQLTYILATSAGSLGMAGGQALDLEMVNQDVTIESLEAMHRKKTGCLIQACIHMPQACAQQLTQNQRQSLMKFADYLGLAFQIRDDILDEISDTSTLGKPQGSDRAQNKPTYVSVLGIEEAQNRCQDLHQQALECIQDFNSSADTLRLLAEYIVCREH